MSKRSKQVKAMWREDNASRPQPMPMRLWARENAWSDDTISRWLNGKNKA